MGSIILYLGHYSTLASHPGEPRVYDTLRYEYFGSNMSTDVYDSVPHYHHCPQLETKFKQPRHVQLFPPTGPLKFIAINVLDPLTQTKEHNQFEVNTTDRYSKLIRAIQTPIISSTHVARIFLNYWILYHGVLDIIVSVIGQQFVSIVFSSLCSYLRVRK